MRAKQVWVREQGSQVEIFCGGEIIARHLSSEQRHQVVTQREHHAGIPLGCKPTGKTVIRIQQGAPVVETRSLAAYESLAVGGAQ